MRVQSGAAIGVSGAGPPPCHSGSRTDTTAPSDSASGDSSGEAIRYQPAGPQHNCTHCLLIVYQRTRTRTHSLPFPPPPPPPLPPPPVASHSNPHPVHLNSQPSRVWEPWDYPCIYIIEHIAGLKAERAGGAGPGRPCPSLCSECMRTNPPATSLLRTCITSTCCAARAGWVPGVARGHSEWVGIWQRGREGARGQEPFRVHYVVDDAARTGTLCG